MSKLRVGVIGVGKMAEISHLPILARLPQIELTAFCDTSEENLTARGDEYGVAQRYRDHHDMLADERLDAVCLFVPPFAHTDAEVIAARQGVAVFVEKPPTLSMDKAHEISGAITRAVVINAVGFQERYRRATEAARVHISSRRLVQAMIHRLHGSKALAYWWMVEGLSGGAFVENTIHWVDLLRYLGVGVRSHDFHRLCIESGRFDLCLTFCDYNLLDQSAAAGVLVPAAARDVGVLNGAAVMLGLLGGGDPRLVTSSLATENRVRRATELRQWAGERGIGLAALNLQFCLRERRITSTLVGVANPDELRTDLRALEEPIDEEIWDELAERFGISAG